MIKNTVLVALCVATMFSACKKKDEDVIATLETEELAQQAGDMMASIDELGGSSGLIASQMKSDVRLFTKLAPGSVDTPNLLAALALPSAEATACSASTWGALRRQCC